MEDEELETIYDETKKRRVTIFRKKTGTFYYDEEYFSEEKCVGFLKDDEQLVYMTAE